MPQNYATRPDDGRLSMIRRDVLYIRVTINKRSLSYEILKNKPKSMAPNQFAIEVPIEIDEEKWFNRLVEVGTIRPLPSGLPRVTASAWTDKDTPEKVLDRMAGR